MAQPDFCTTRWTLVCGAQGNAPDAREALNELCAAYYKPISDYIGHRARDVGEPADLTQEFFSKLLAGTLRIGASRERGRFRAYMLGAVKHYLADCRDRLGTAKRGAGYVHTAIESGDTDGEVLEVPSCDGALSDRWFDRHWGLAVLSTALTQLEAEHERVGKVELFQRLKPFLTGESSAPRQAAVAEELGMTEGALKAAIHRLRQRFRSLVIGQIQQTVATAEDLREELRYLIEVVSQPG